MQVGELGEFGLIDRLVRLVGGGDASIILGAGDDTAALRLSRGALLLATCDSLVEGRHFLRDRMLPEDLGRRLAAVNLSDIAAMGGRPRWALASLVLPAATEVSFVETVYRGLAAELGRFGAHVVGGNLTAGEQLVLDLTLFGEAPHGKVVGRGGAQAGNALLVSGNVGASAAGRAALDNGLQGVDADGVIAAHLAPDPRVAEGQTIAASGLATAMIDVSDGLAQDLGHICDASGVGVIVEAASLPISAATKAIALRLNLDPVGIALRGGEDYELLCTAPVEASSKLSSLVEQATGVHLSRIGEILPLGEGRWLRLADGSRDSLGAGGWQHFA